MHQILRWIDVGLCFAYNITFLFQHWCIEDSLPSLVTTFSTVKVLATLCELWNTSFIQWWHFFIHYVCEKVRESKLSCGCAVHILLALMVLTWLDCCGAFEDGNVFSEEEVKGGCSVGINVHMRNTSQVFFRDKTWARNPGCLIRVTLGSDDCLLMLILAPHCH